MTTTTTNERTTNSIVSHYHNTLHAARALRAIYIDTIRQGAPAERIESARRHYQAAWSQYVALCRRHGLLACHS